MLTKTCTKNQGIIRISQNVDKLYIPRFYLARHTDSWPIFLLF